MASMNLAYLAGIIDGEGCIGFTRIRGQLVPRVSVTNTNLQLIEDLKSKFGGCILTRKPHKPNWKPASHWVISNRKAVELIDRIYRYLRVKSDQAKCLFLHDAIRPGKGFRWTDEGIESCKLLEDQIRWLNKKGSESAIEPMTSAYSEAREGKKRKK